MKQKIKELTDLLLKAYKINLESYDADFIIRTVSRRMDTISNCESMDDYLALLKVSMKEALDLQDAMQISYSEFFRNPLTYAVLEKIIIPAYSHSNKKKELRIWSAACAAGQEVYSIAILLNENCANTKFRIFATDIAENQLQEASRGIYPEFSIENLTHKRLNRWFNQNGKSYEIQSGLKKNIDFSLFDLLNKNQNCPPSSIYGDFDLIFCANVLFYYKSTKRKFIIEKLLSSMSENGLLICDETEREYLFGHNLEEIYPQSAIFRRKRFGEL